MTDAELAAKMAEIEQIKADLEKKDAEMRRRVKAARKRLQSATPKMSLRFEPYTATMRDVYGHLATHNEVLLEVLDLLVEDDEPKPSTTEVAQSITP